MISDFKIWDFKEFRRWILLLFLLFVIIKVEACNSCYIHRLWESSGNNTSDTVGVYSTIEYDQLFRGNIDSLNLPDFLEGPHVFWEDSSRVTVWYAEHNQSANTMQVRTKKMKVKKDSALLKWQSMDTQKYWVWRRYQSEQDEFSGVSRIMALGDVHGEYDALVEMLRAGDVIDENLDWIWGEGHLVFIGDVLDRGSKVTECLWLIRKLSRQAKIKGGRVHYLLGNHEIMVLMKDARYSSQKYKNMCKRLVMNYYRFYANDTELGRWLRSLNCVVKINDLIFVHAGLSPGVLEKKLSIRKLNQDINLALNNSEELSSEQIMDVLTDPENPMWYRGYLVKTRSYPRITQEELDEVLSYYDVSHIVFGHTEVNSIWPMFQNRILAIDVPLGVPDVQPQMLLIDQNRFYRVYKNGHKEVIF